MKGWDIDWAKVNLCLLVFILSLLTRFVPPIEPQHLAFDEAYFIPQSESYAVGSYYFDPHPPLGKILLYLGSIGLDPSLIDRVDADKVGSGPFSSYEAASLEGSRFTPRVAGSLVPVVIFLLAWEVVNWKSQRKSFVDALVSSNYLVPLVIGILAVFENMLIVDSRYTLLTQIMLLFILSGIYFAFKYFKSGMNNSRFWYLAFSAIAIGLAVSTKWLGLSFVPAVVGLVVIKELAPLTKKKFLLVVSNLYVCFAIVTVIPVLIYLAGFALHFSQIRQFQGAHSITEEYKQELTTGEVQLSLWDKIMDWHQLTVEMENAIPKIDRENPGEIGSTWLEWPTMTRPILYAIDQVEGDTYGYVFLIGNPFSWFIGLASIIVVAFLCLSELIETLWNFFEYKRFKPAFRFRYWLILGLFLANWLPFALIHRVMYLYHFVPSMVLSLIAFGLIMHDVIVPLLSKLVHRLLPRQDLAVIQSFILITICTLILLASLGVFYIYAPLTYQWPINREYLQLLELMDSWELVW
jgi:dolichyl-phosphate-mannose--protein O-mannosyl transferase